MLHSVTEHIHFHSDKWMPFYNYFMKKKKQTTNRFGRQGCTCADSTSENTNMKAVSMHFHTLAFSYSHIFSAGFFSNFITDTSFSNASLFYF